MRKPIGTATYAGGGIVAELLGVDEWRVTVAGKDDPGMARNLTAIYRDAYGGPSDGYYGQRILRDLAERMGGTYTFRDLPPPDPHEIH